MIIKSMSRKSKSFSQLYDYLKRDKNSFSFVRNMYSNPQNRKELIKEFYQNAKHIENSRGKVFMYHELLSLEKNDLPLEKQKEILYDLAMKYLELRASEQLSLGVIHQDKEHIHIHLMISANKCMDNKRVRLSKKEFSNIQKNLELYKNQKYLELNESKLYQSKKDISKSKKNEQEIKYKRKETTMKDKLKEFFAELFEKSTSRLHFENQLKNLGYELYEKGNTIGVSYKNKNYRLKTLSVEKKFKDMFKRFEKTKEREIKRQRVKKDRSYSKEYFRSRWKNKLNQLTWRDKTLRKL